MSNDAAARLNRWLAWLGDNPTDDEMDEVFRRWEQGEEPPAVPRQPGWETTRYEG